MQTRPRSGGQLCQLCPRTADKTQLLNMNLQAGIPIFLFLLSLQASPNEGTSDAADLGLTGLRDVRYRHFLEVSRSITYSGSRTKRSAIFSTGVKVCPQETAKAVISSHRAYYKLRVCQEAIWEAFRIFYDRVPNTEEYMVWVYACQHENLCMDDLARNFSSSQEHLDMVARRVAEMGESEGFLVETPEPGRDCPFTPQYKEIPTEPAEVIDEANAIPEKPQQYIVEFSVTVVDPIYGEMLQDPTAPQYADVIRELRDEMYHVFEKIPGFKEIRVVGFRAEDVSVRYAVLFNGDTELSDQPEGYHTSDVETQKEMTAPKLQNIIVRALKQELSLPLDLNTLSFNDVYEVDEYKNKIAYTVAPSIEESPATTVAELKLQEDSHTARTFTHEAKTDFIWTEPEQTPAHPAEDAVTKGEHTSITEDNDVSSAELVTAAPEEVILVFSADPPLSTTKSNKYITSVYPAEYTLPGTSPDSSQTEGDSGLSPEAIQTEGDSGLSPEAIQTKGDSGLSSEAVPTEGDSGLSSEAVPTEGDSGLSSEAVPTEGDSGMSSEAVPTEGDSGLSSEAVPAEGDRVMSSEAVPPEGDSGLSSEAVPTEGDRGMSSEAVPPEGDSGLSSEAVPTEGDRGMSSEAVPTEGDRGMSSEAVPTEGDRGMSSEAVPPEGDSGLSSEAVPTEGDRGMSSEAVPTEGDRGMSSEAVPTEGDRGMSSEAVPPEGDSGRSESSLTEADSGSGLSPDSSLMRGDSGSGLFPEADRSGNQVTLAPAMRQASTPLTAVDKNRDLVVLFSLRVTNMMFTDSLINKDSAEYKSLENTFLELLLPYLETNLTGFKALEILSFQNGSVIVNSRMKLNKAVPYNITEAVHCVLEDFCNSASNQLEIQVDSRSLEVEQADEPDPCKSVTCSEFSRCVVNGWSGEAECLCDPGYSAVDGQPCQSVCTMKPDFCLNGGLCQNIPGHGATCRCPVGKHWHYHGEHCEELVTLPMDTSFILTGLVGSICLVAAVIGILIFINKKCIKPQKAVTVVHTLTPYVFDNTIRDNPVFQNDDDEYITQVSTLPYPPSPASSQSQSSEHEHFASIENIHLSIEIPRQLYTTRSEKLVSNIADFHHCIPHSQTWRASNQRRCCFLRASENECLEVTMV